MYVQINVLVALFKSKYSVVLIFLQLGTLLS